MCDMYEPAGQLPTRLSHPIYHSWRPVLLMEVPRSIKTFTLEAMQTDACLMSSQYGLARAIGVQTR